MATIVGKELGYNRHKGREDTLGIKARRTLGTVGTEGRSLGKVFAESWCLDTCVPEMGSSLSTVNTLTLC